MNKVIATLDFFQKSLFDKYGLDLEAAKKQPTTSISFLTQGAIPNFSGTNEGQVSPGSKATWSSKLKKWLPMDAFSSLTSGPTKLIQKKLEPDAIKAILSILNNLQGNLEIKKAIESAEFNKIYDTYEEYVKKSQESPKDIKENDPDKEDKIKYNKKIEEAKKDLSQKQMAISHFWKDFENKNTSVISNRIHILESLSKIMDDGFVNRVKNVFLAIPEASEVKKHIQNSLEKFQEVPEDIKEKEKEIEIDKDKKDFNKKDLDFIIQVIKKHHGPAGAHWRDVSKYLSKYFNPGLMSTLEFISKKESFPKGMINFLENYEEMKAKLKEEPLTLAPSTDLIESNFKKSIGDVLANLEDIRKINPGDYKNSAFQYVENFVKFFREYLKNQKRNPVTEQLMGTLIREVTKLSSSLRSNPMSKNMRTLRDQFLAGLANMPITTKTKELEENQKLSPDKLIDVLEKEHKNIPMVNEIKKFLSDIPKEVSEKDKDLKSLFKEHKEQKIEDIVKSSSVLKNYKNTPYATLDKVIASSPDIVIKNELENIRFLLYAYV